MRTIKIRDLRGSLVEELSRSEAMVGITNYRALAAVMIPVGAGWVDHLVESNWSRLMQSVAEGEDERGSGQRFVPLESDDGEGAAPDPQVSSSPSPESKTELDLPLQIMRRVAHAFSHRSEDAPPAHFGTVRSVRIGGLSGEIIQEAGESGEFVALTNDRRLVAFLVPVTDQLVAHLIENNLTRIMFNVERGEHERESESTLITLDELVDTRAEDVDSEQERPSTRSIFAPTLRRRVLR